LGLNKLFKKNILFKRIFKYFIKILFSPPLGSISIISKNAWKKLASQDKSNINTWRALTRSFLNHYRFNLKMIPTREEVEGMRPFIGENIKVLLISGD